MNEFAVVKRSADPSFVLFTAASIDNVEVLEAMIAKGGNPNVSIQGLGGWTPVTMAAAQGASSAVSALLRHGADPNRPNDLGRTALMFAANYGQTEIIRLLVKAGANVRARPNSEPRFSALLAAASNGHVDAVRVLLELGADINDSDDDGQTALMLASAKGHSSVVRELVTRGVDVNTTGRGGINAIAVAVVEGQAEVVDLLLDDRVKLNVRAGQFGNTPLALAISLGRTQIAQKLLAAGADPNLSASRGLTPLMIATMRSNLELVQTLIDKGADINARNVDGATAIQLAAQQTDKRIVEKLRQAGAREE
ncbi:MAG TPA: ankyrin repeat domain-containing protein [Vicinamibacterales bacterium]|nr:ankyrin repeat domain-containing protein [Vicinamibacterales bacterium]